MNPTLIAFGNFEIKTFGVFLLVAFLAAEYIVWREGSKKGYNEEKLLDLGIICFLYSFVFSRLGYVLLHLNQFQDNPITALFFWQGGLDFIFGLVGGLIGYYYFIRRNKWSFFEVGDFYSVALLLAYIIGKVGLYLSGEGTVGSQPLRPLAAYFSQEISILIIFLLVLVYMYRFRTHVIMLPLLKKKVRLASQGSGGVFFLSLIVVLFTRLLFGFLRRVEFEFVVSHLTLFTLSIIGLYFYQTKRLRSIETTLHLMSRNVPKLRRTKKASKDPILPAVSTKETRGTPKRKVSRFKTNKAP